MKLIRSFAKIALEGGRIGGTLGKQNAKEHLQTLAPVHFFHVWIKHHNPTQMLPSFGQSNLMLWLQEVVTKAGFHPSRVDFVTLDGPRLVMGVRVQPVAVAFSLQSKEGDLSADTEHMAFFPFGKLPLQPAAGNKVLKITISACWFARNQSCVRESRQMAFKKSQACGWADSSFAAAFND